MTFDIDAETIPPTDARALLPDWFMDQQPEDVTEYKAAHDYAYHLIHHFKQPKTMATVRRHFLMRTQFLARLAELDGDLFDEVLCAYAERALIFDQPHAA